METSDTKVSDFSVFLRVIKTNQKEWWIAILGVIGAIMLGAAFPTFALIFGEILEAFVQPPSLVLPGIHLWAGLFFLLGFLAGLGGFVKVSVSTISVVCHLVDIFYVTVPTYKFMFYRHSASVYLVKT